MGKPHYSNDKDLHRHVAGLVKQGWTFTKGKTHGKLVAPNGRRMAVPVSPSDRRGFENHVHQVERLQALPAGPIRKRKGKCH